MSCPGNRICPLRNCPAKARFPADHAVDTTTCRASSHGLPLPATLRLLVTTGSKPSPPATPPPSEHGHSAIPKSIPARQTASQTSIPTRDGPRAASVSCSASTVAGSETTAKTAYPAPSVGSRASPSLLLRPAPPAGSPAQNHRHKTAPAPRTRPLSETTPCAPPSWPPAQTSSPPACPPPAPRTSFP